MWCSDSEFSKVHFHLYLPKPSSPKRFSLGILQLSNISAQVEEPLIPNLSSFLPSSNPSTGLGMMIAEIPLCFRLLSVVANTTPASLSNAFVIHDFVPFRRKLSPSDLAVVEAAPASDPLPGSENRAAKEAMPLCLNMHTEARGLIFSGSLISE
ncbi:hypothetical protein HUJ05_008647 [Dendroctonus ponderosae]|nr:hypothetical protein HUJ05_008647 [Dendroctonus ponderosae]